MSKEKETEEEKRARELVEEIASNIAALSRSVSSLLNGRLNRKAVLVLLAHSTKMTQQEVDAVLDALTGLEAKYLK